MLRVFSLCSSVLAHASVGIRRIFVSILQNHSFKGLVSRTAIDFDDIGLSLAWDMLSRSASHWHGANTLNHVPIILRRLGCAAPECVSGNIGIEWDA